MFCSESCPNIETKVECLNVSLNLTSEKDAFQKCTVEIETQIERHKLHVNFQHTFNSLSVRSLVLSNAVAPPFGGWLLSRINVK